MFEANYPLHRLVFVEPIIDYYTFSYWLMFFATCALLQLTIDIWPFFPFYWVSSFVSCTLMKSCWWLASLHWFLFVIWHVLVIDASNWLVMIEVLLWIFPWILQETVWIIIVAIIWDHTISNLWQTAFPIHASFFLSFLQWFLLVLLQNVDLCADIYFFWYHLFLLIHELNFNFFTLHIRKEWTLIYFDVLQ